MTAATGKPRGRKPGSPKTGGRVAGGRSLDKGERQLVTAKMAGDLLDVYERLGGADWLLKFAKDNPAEFLRQGLSRLFPAPDRGDEAGNTFNQVNFNNLDMFEAARRIAFVMNAGIIEQRELAPVAEPATIEAERVPEEPPQRMYQGVPWRAPADAPDMLPPEPVEDPERERWASELPLTPEERQDQKLIRQTKEASIVNYCGSSAEQGGTPSSRPEQRVDPRSAQRDRMLKRNSLL